MIIMWFSGSLIIHIRKHMQMEKTQAAEDNILTSLTTHAQHVEENAASRKNTTEYMTTEISRGHWKINMVRHGWKTLVVPLQEQTSWVTNQLLPAMFTTFYCPPETVSIDTNLSLSVDIF